MEVGLSVTGGYVYRGSAIPRLQGKYVFGDWSTGFGSPNGTLLGLEEGPPGVFTLSKLTIVGGNPIGRYIPGFGVGEDGGNLHRDENHPRAVRSGTGRQSFGSVVQDRARGSQQHTGGGPGQLDFSEQTSNSNGAGELFAGLIANTSGNRRALVRFDLSSVPSGSTVTAAAVTMQVTKTSVRHFRRLQLLAPQTLAGLG